jgi:hypothetical protein
MPDSNQQGGTTTLQLVLAWGFVGIPLALGVLETLINSMKTVPIASLSKQMPLPSKQRGKQRTFSTTAEPYTYHGPHTVDSPPDR